MAGFGLVLGRFLISSWMKKRSRSKPNQADNPSAPTIGQIISECLFYVFQFSKKNTKKFDKCDGTFYDNSSFFFFQILISKQIALASLFSFPLRIKTSFRKNITDDSIFLYGSGMNRKHPNHTYGRNQNNSANNRVYKGSVKDQMVKVRLIFPLRKKWKKKEFDL